MDLRELSNSLSFCFLLIIMLLLSLRAHGSSRSSGGLTTKDVVRDLAVDGICASAVISKGYKCQEIEVTTKDGYILGMQRIPEGRVPGVDGVVTKQPVLLQHGITTDGLSWLLNPQNLPMTLADNGYDVWIANTRGTRFSRRHTSLQPYDPNYWNWSWDELAAYDLTAFVDYVQSQTGQKVHYVGHSLGTLIALAALSDGLEVDKIKSAVLLCPIAYLSHMRMGHGAVAAKSSVGDTPIAEFNPTGEPARQLDTAPCVFPGVDCYNFSSEIPGENCCVSPSALALFLENGPEPTSIKNMEHLGQITRDRVIAKYNYDNPISNEMHYRQPSPPVYNLSNIPHDLPLFLSHGGLDALSDVEDVNTLLEDLKSHDADKLSVQFIEQYGHVDFIMAANAKDLVYSRVLSFFKDQL